MKFRDGKILAGRISGLIPPLPLRVGHRVEERELRFVGRGWTGRQQSEARNFAETLRFKVARLA